MRRWILYETTNKLAPEVFERAVRMANHYDKNAALISALSPSPKLRCDCPLSTWPSTRGCVLGSLYPAIRRFADHRSKPNSLNKRFAFLPRGVWSSPN